MRINIALIVIMTFWFLPNRPANAKNQPLTLSDPSDLGNGENEPPSSTDLVILRKCGLTEGQAIGLARRNKVKINCEVAIEQVIRSIISGKKTLTVIKEVVFALQKNDRYVIAEILDEQTALLVDKSTDIVLVLDNYPDSDLQKGAKLNELGYWGVKVTGTTTYQTRAGISKQAWLIEVVK
jgi:hypothetical protein